MYSLLLLLVPALAQDLFLSLSGAPSQRELEYHHRNPGFFDPSLLLREEHQTTNVRESFQRATRLHRAAHAAISASAQTPAATVINPIDFGADPTGTSSSSAAFDAAVASMIRLARDDRKDFLGHYDLGGATLDLHGGIYLIDRPVSFPSLYANFRVQYGTLMASPSFPRDSYMLIVGDGRCKDAKDGGCNRNIDISHMTVDGQSHAFGGIVVNHTMNINIGPAMYITSWTGVGISLEGSGAGQIHQAWLGEIPPGSPISRNTARGTAILLASGEHDAQVSDIIVFSGKKGVVSQNGANRLQGVHAWNLAGKSGGVGIELGNAWGGPSGGRVQDSYLDYAPLVITNPGDCMVTGNLFLGSSSIVLRATKNQVAVRNLIVTSNTHHSSNTGNKSFVLDEEAGKFTSVVDTVIENNEVDSLDLAAGKAGTRATKSAVLKAGAISADIYFDKDLIFNTPIDHASVRCWLYGPFATAVVGHLKYDQCVTAVLAEAVPSGAEVTVTCSVDQSVRACPAH